VVGGKTQWWQGKRRITFWALLEVAASPAGAAPPATHAIVTMIEERSRRRSLVHAIIMMDTEMEVVTAGAPYRIAWHG
jgi:hypothetical protein